MIERAPVPARGPERRSDGFRHRFVDVGSVRLHVAEATPEGVGADVPRDVPLVVFLHGFPELWWSWRHQLTAAARAGLWAVAPDMRGYAESDKPEGVGAYEIEELTADVAGLIRALGRERAIVVGHDWGAMVAWYFAERHAGLLERLAILNVPHPSVMTRALLTRPAQIRKSWYIFFFQLPLLPERKLAANDFESLRRMFRADGFDAETTERYIDAIRIPGSLRAALAYYRAAMRRVMTLRVPRSRPIEAPVLVLWGDEDRVFVPDLAEPPRDLVPKARVVHLPDANHWLQSLAPDQVNEHLVPFLR